MSVAERMAELGISLPQVAWPLALYRPAVRSGRMVYVSGQVASREGEIVNPGRLGDGLSVEQGQEAARAAILNALAAASDLLGGPEALDGVRVVRLVGYVACTPDFHDQPAVVNGASELLRDLLGDEAGVGARVALGVAALPAGTAVELELLLEATE